MVQIYAAAALATCPASWGAVHRLCRVGEGGGPLRRHMAACQNKKLCVLPMIPGLAMICYAPQLITAVCHD